MKLREREVTVSVGEILFLDKIEKEFCKICKQIRENRQNWLDNPRPGIVDSIPHFEILASMFFLEANELVEHYKELL